MPQVDLDIFVPSVCSGGSDRKIACETLADPTHDPITRPDAPPSLDFPPESYFLSEDAQIEWLSQNAFFERKESQKGNSTSNSNLGSSFNPNSNPSSNSQRISLKSKASIIGLPKPQKTCFDEAKNRRNCRIAKTLMIPKRVGSRLKSDPSLSEPSSPKVSCMGRVRSKRDRSRSRSRRVHRQKSIRSDPVIDEPNRSRKPGFFASIRAIFRTGGGCKSSSTSAREPHTTQVARDIRYRLPPDDVDSRKSAGSRRSFDGEPGRSGLGGNRFASGRRSDLLVDIDVA